MLIPILLFLAGMVTGILFLLGFAAAVGHMNERHEAPDVEML